MRTAIKVAITLGILAVFLTGIIIGLMIIIQKETGKKTEPTRPKQLSFTGNPNETEETPELNLPQEPLFPFLESRTVMVIPIRGMITSEDCGGDFISGTPTCANPSFLKERLKEASDDNNIKAVVLDINSGGGEVVASREMMRSVRDFDKPIVARIGEIGASGAYYVASASDYIIADDDSITGSIGVIMEIQQYYGLMEKLGLNVTTIKAGKNKDSGSPYRPMEPEEKDRFQSLLDQVHQDFINDVAQNRGLDKEQVTNLATGDVYLGKEAVGLGLVDGLGGMDEATLKAAEIAGIEGQPDVVERPNDKLTLADLLSSMSANAGYGLGRALLAQDTSKAQLKV
ncbi:Peptidase family S49 [uncultured archaeon]|nr:Peptidase family S49 [uncultured archaeon]